MTFSMPANYSVPRNSNQLASPAAQRAEHLKKPLNSSSDTKPVPELLILLKSVLSWPSVASRAATLAVFLMAGH